MATLGTYYIDTSSLATATAVWTDATFSTKAADGWYQACGTVREQTGGFLLPPDSCNYPCDVDCGDPPVFDWDYFGVFNLPDIQITAGTGAVEVDLNIGSGSDRPVGVFVTYDGTIYSEMISSIFGYVGGPYIGDVAQFVAAGFPGGSPYLLPTFEFDGVDGSGANIWTPNGTESVNIPLADTDSTAGSPGILTLFVPKPLAAPQTMVVKLIAPVGQALAGWTLTNKCPVALTARAASANVASSVLACPLPFTKTIYNGPIQGTPGIIGFNDLIFVDENAEVKLADVSGAGFYKWQRPVPFPTDGWFEIDVNSVVLTFGSC